MPRKLKPLGLCIIAASLAPTALLLNPSCGQFEPMTIQARYKGTTVSESEPGDSTHFKTLIEHYPELPTIPALESRLEGMGALPPSLAKLTDTMLEEAAKRQSVAQVTAIVKGIDAILTTWESGDNAARSLFSDLGQQTAVMRTTPLAMTPYVDALAAVFQGLLKSPLGRSENAS